MMVYQDNETFLRQIVRIVDERQRFYQFMKHVREERGGEALRILNRNELGLLADVIGVADSWHEPDEHGVDAVVYGRSFDNCGKWPMTGSNEHVAEMYVTVIWHGMIAAYVNLADLMAWSSPKRV